MTPVYCIAKHAKLKSFGAIAGSAAHNFRTMKVPNVDPARTGLNTTIGASTPKALIKALKTRLVKLKKKPRSGAVLILEYLVSYSPEWTKAAAESTRLQYLRDGVESICKRHGLENVLAVNYQFDETTLHAVVYVLPITPDGRLCCRDFTGGSAMCSKFQTEFWKAVGMKYGLLRGVQGAKARYVKAKQFAGMMAAAPTWEVPSPPELTKMDWITGGAKSKLDGYASRLAEFAAMVEKRNDLAVHREKARVEQNKGVMQLRAKLAKLEKSEARALHLEVANQILADELDAEKRAAEQAKDTTARLTRKLEALQSAMAATTEEHDIEEEWAPANR
jgi:hypothetical protein